MQLLVFIFINNMSIELISVFTFLISHKKSDSSNYA